MERKAGGPMVKRALDRAPLVVLAALAAGLTMASAAASAQDQERARLLFEQGVSSMDAGNAQAATGYFQESYQIYPRASTACNMALALERSNRSCDAQSWYRQCAALDTSGRFRDHANRQAAALDSQCQAAGPSTTPNNPQSPFVSGPQPIQNGRVAAPPASSGQGVQVVEGTQTTHRYVPQPNHTLLGVGIPAVLLGVGAIVGGGFAAGEANYQAAFLPPGGADLVEGQPLAQRYYDARTFSNLALGLYIGGALLGAAGAILIAIDLAQPNAFGDSARSSEGPRLTLAGRPEGGAEATLSARF